MSLSQVEFSTREIVVGTSSFEVRGLSVSDIVSLVRDHYNPLNDLFKEIVKQGADDPASIESAALRFLERSPDVVASVVALAADENTNEGRAAFQKLPLGIQLEVIDAIVELTFDSMGGPKKAIETVKKIVQAFRS